MKTIEERKVANKAIILSRVSSKEQEEGYSITAQKHLLNEYCTRKGLEIIRVFEFSESSTITNRTKFMEAINFAKGQKEIIAIVTDKVDRLQRSHREYNMLEDLISKEKIELHFHTENCIIHKYSTSQERMMWNVHVMMSQSYVDSLRDNVNRSIAHKLRCGEWVSGAPIGYLHVPNPNKERGSGTIVVDEERAPLIKRLFEEYSTGSYSLLEMLRKAKEWGLTNSRGNKGRLSRNQIYAILENPFYHGVMRLQKNGKEYPHIYPPIISKELYDACQDIRLGRKNKPFKHGEKEFIFRGLIRCGVTNRTVTAMEKVKTYTNGNKGRWVYLIAADPKNPDKKMYVKEEAVTSQIEEVLKTMDIDPELKRRVIAYIDATANQERNLHENRISELNAANTKINSRISKLTDVLLDEVINKEEFEEKKEELIKKRQETQQEIEYHANAAQKFSDGLLPAVEEASQAYEAFRGSNYEEKRQLVNSVFLNLKLKGRKLDYSLRPALL